MSEYHQRNTFHGDVTVDNIFINNRKYILGLPRYTPIGYLFKQTGEYYSGSKSFDLHCLSALFSSLILKMKISLDKYPIELSNQDLVKINKFPIATEIIEGAINMRSISEINSRLTAKKGT